MMLISKVHSSKKGRCVSIAKLNVHPRAFLLMLSSSAHMH